MQLRFAIPVLAALALFGCSLPTMRSSSSSTSGSATASSSTTTLSVSVDSRTNEGVLVTPNGRIPITAVTSNGSTVVCTDPISVHSLDTGSGTTAAILGNARDGRPAVWIYSGGKIFAPENEKTGKIDPYLSESPDVDGAFGWAFGWSYQETGMVHHLIAGYATNAKGVKFGSYTISPGTTVGVYWRIYSRRAEDHHGRGHHLRWILSPAHVIGTLATTTQSTKTGDNHPWDGHHGDRGSRHANWVLTKLNLLKLFLFQDYSAYLTTVDAKKAILYDKSTDTYTVSGTDENGTPASAAIAPDNTITITESQVSSASLTPTEVSYSGSAATNGGTLAVTVTIANSGSTSVSTSFPVDFYLSTSTTYSPSSDPSAGSITVSQTIAGQSSVSASGTIQLPTLPSSDFGTTGTAATYLYAVVDPNDVTGASTSPSNTSTASTAASLTVMASTSSGTYSMLIETYDPSSPTTNPGPTGAANPGVALYKTAGTGMLKLMTGGQNYYSFMSGGVAYYNGFTADNLQPNTTYYVAVESAVIGGGGPYAIILLPAGSTATLPTLTPLSAPPAGATNTSPIVPMSGSVPPSQISPVPTGAIQLQVGTPVNQYLATSTNYTNWFEFTMP